MLLEQIKGFYHGIIKIFLLVGSYHISRNIGGDLNLAIWRMLDKSPNLKIANLIFVHLSWHSKHW